MAEVLTCYVCGNVGFDDGSNGFFYCMRCGSQAEDIVETGDDQEAVDLIGTGHGSVYSSYFLRQKPAAPQNNMVSPLSQFWSSLAHDNAAAEKDQACVADTDVTGPTGPSDFGSGLDESRPLCYDDYYSEIRIRYVMGIQLMIQLQCQAYVETFGVTELVCGLAASLWFRYVVMSGVFDDNWADETIRESEIQKSGEAQNASNVRYKEEPRNIHGQRAVLIWLKSLRRSIPIHCSLVISFLACHIARSRVLPTDIIKWSLEGNLPYFSAFIEIEKVIGQPSKACPISSISMFRPSEFPSLQNFETLTASLGQSLGLDLPPVNFHAISTCYLNQLFLPSEKIMPYACKMYEWLMPPELWLSTNESRLPTRVGVMSILVVSIRILYNINGLGIWESSLSTGRKLESETAELLSNLEARYDEIAPKYEYSKDLATYLQFCKDVVFAGVKPSLENHEEEKIIESLWDYYEKEDCPLLAEGGIQQKRSRSNERFSNNFPDRNKKIRDNNETSRTLNYEHRKSEETKKEKAIGRLKLDMEEHMFYYMPPRKRVTKPDYFVYERKLDEGALTYIADADYYILLRACARVVQIDVRVMHDAVSRIERRLAWIEKRINYCLHLKHPAMSCDFCSNVAPVHGTDDSCSSH